MPATIRPILVTADLDRLLAFYSGLLGTTEVSRFPDDGPVFFVDLRLGNSELGLVSDANAVSGPAGRVLLSIDVDDVESLLPQVAKFGGEAPSPANDMPWVSGSRTSRIPTATPST